MSEMLPLFPLGAVLFPGVVLPLRVFEERYRAMVHNLMDAPADEPRRFGVVAVRRGSETAARTAGALHPVGCAAEVQRVEGHEDGTFDVVTVGVRRFRLLDVDADSQPYLVGDVAWLPAETDAGPEAAVLAARVGALFVEYLEAVAGTGGAQVAPFELPDDPTLLTYLVASAAMLTITDRQALLEIDDTADRLRAEIRLLRREIVLVRELSAVPMPSTEFEHPGPG